MMSVPVELAPAVQAKFLESVDELLDKYGKTVKTDDANGTVSSLVWLGATDPKTQDTMYVSRDPNGKTEVLLGTAIRPKPDNPTSAPNYTFYPGGGVVYSSSSDSPVMDKPVELFDKFVKRYERIATYASFIGRARSIGGRVLSGKFFQER